MKTRFEPIYRKIIYVKGKIQQYKKTKNIKLAQLKKKREEF